MSAFDEQCRRIVEIYFGITLEQDSSLLDKLEVEHLAGGEWLFHQGDTGDSLYFLVRGRLQVWIDDDAEGGGRRQRYIGEIAPGDSVGEISLLTGEQRTAGIRAIRDSLLVKINRDAFQNLAQQHPALVLKLAGSVASVLYKRTSRRSAATRNLRTITVLPLGGSPRVTAFCKKLAAELGGQTRCLHLSADNLEQHGAPVRKLQAREPAPAALQNWLHEQESQFRFLVFDCQADDDTWTRFALRQSDLVLLVADAGDDPGPKPWELRLSSGTDASIARRMMVLLQPPAPRPIRDTANWLADRAIDFHIHVRADQPDDIGRVTRIILGQATGLILAGGAARGIAHLGVFKALRELGIKIDWLAGVSMGAILGGGIACDWDLDYVLESARKSLVNARPFSDFTLPLISLVSGRRMNRLLTTLFDRQIEDLPIPYFCISCNLDSGILNVHESGSLAAAMRASAAVPGIFPPAVVDHRLVIDGSVINNLPVDIMQQKPVGKIIAVDLSSYKEYRVDYDRMPSPWAVLRGRLLPFMPRYRVPGLTTVLLKSTEIGRLDWARELGKQADLLLRPPVRKFGMTDVKSFDRILATSYEYAKNELANWNG